MNFNSKCKSLTFNGGIKDTEADWKGRYFEESESYSSAFQVTYSK